MISTADSRHERSALMQHAGYCIAGLHGRALATAMILESPGIAHPPVTVENGVELWLNTLAMSNRAKTGRPPQRAPLGDAFGRLRIINLRRRADRRAETLAELTQLGESLEATRQAFFEAIEPSTAAGFPSAGVRGCYLSHLAVLEQALEDRVDTILVMEDDITFVRDARRQLAEATRGLAVFNWDIAYFGHAQGRLPGAPGWKRVPGPMRFAHCYAVNGRTLQRLVDFLHQILAREPGHPDGGPMHFDGALSTFLGRNPDIQAYYFSRNLAYQRPSRTDLHRPSLLDRTPVLRRAAAPLRWLKRRYLKLVR